MLLLPKNFCVQSYARKSPGVTLSEETRGIPATTRKDLGHVNAVVVASLTALGLVGTAAEAAQTGTSTGVVGDLFFLDSVLHFL